MNLFDDRNGSDQGAGEFAPEASEHAQVAVLLRALLDRLGTIQKVAKEVRVCRGTLTRWRQGKSLPPWAVDRLTEALEGLGARDEIQGRGYTVHGESDELPMVKHLKTMMGAAVRVRKAGLKIEADEIDRAVIEMADELKEFYHQPSEGKFLAIQASSQTGMGSIDAAIKSFDAATDAMRTAKNEVEVYRYTMSSHFLQMKRAWAARSPQNAGALRELLGRVQQFAENAPPQATNAALAQRIGVLLTTLAMAPDKDGFRQVVKSLFEDGVARATNKEIPADLVSIPKRVLPCHALYGGVNEAKAAVRAIVADNGNGAFDSAIKGKWLSVLKAY